MQTLRVLRAYVRLNLQIIFAYRLNTLVDLGVALMWLVWELVSLGVIYNNTDAIGGWKAGDLIALLGASKVLHAVMFTMIWPNTDFFNKAVRDGTLDYTFLMPANSQLLVSINRLTVWQLHNIVQAFILVPLGIWMSARTTTPADLLLFVALCLSGMLIVYSLWIVLIAAVFWFTKFDNNVTIIQAMMDTGRYPATIYPTWLRILVTFVVPIAVATTVPIQALRGELPVLQGMGFLLFGVAALWGASLVWRAGVRRYSGASA